MKALIAVQQIHLAESVGEVTQINHRATQSSQAQNRMKLRTLYTELLGHKYRLKKRR